jgi:CrcB protein
LIAAGFCGALTTFSTFELELLRMLDRGRVALALAYAAASIAGGLGAVLLGTKLGRRRSVTR